MPLVTAIRREMLVGRIVSGCFQNFAKYCMCFRLLCRAYVFETFEQKSEAGPNGK